MDKLIELYKQHIAVVGWLPEVLGIFLLTAGIYFVQKIFISNVIKRSLAEKNLYINTILHAVSVPISFTIWIVGLIYIAITVREYFNGINLDLSWLETAARIVIILTVAWVFKRIIGRLEYNLVNPIDGRKPVDKTTALAMGRLGSILLIVVVGLVLMQTLQINVAGIITLGSAGTLVVGIAAKDMLANFFGGFMIFTDRPFKVGDWIKSPDKNIEGYVEHIGWRVTRIRTFEKRPLYVQNSIFLNISIENPSRMTNRRIREQFGLRYADMEKVKKINDEVEEMLKSHPDIDARQAIFVAFNQFGDSTLDCLVYCFTKATKLIEYSYVKQDIFIKIAAIVQKHGADMAFPTITLDLPEQALAQS